MFCVKCGAPNDDNAYKCTSCGTVLQRAAPPTTGGLAAPGTGGLGPAKHHLAQSIIVTVLCCMPAGVAAIVYSAMAMSKNGEGDYQTAHRYAKSASMWGWISFGVGLVVIVGWVLLNIAAGAGSGFRP
jgi:hypothetical protein